MPTCITANHRSVWLGVISLEGGVKITACVVARHQSNLGLNLVCGECEELLVVHLNSLYLSKGTIFDSSKPHLLNSMVPHIQLNTHFSRTSFESF